MNKKQKKRLWRIVAASVIMLALHAAGAEGALLLTGSAVAYLIVGYDIILKALRGVTRGALMDENFLMTVASLGAFALGVYEQSGEYSEGVAVMLFYRLGELLQSCAVGKSRRDITELMDMRPENAHVETEEGEEERTPQEVPPGSVIVVQPGEKVPLDGVALTGDSSLDMSALTGESTPREVSAGDAVSSGSINLRGLLRLRTTHTYDESTVSKILELVEEATSRKSRAEQFITKFARVYTPLVCAGALLLALLPPLALAAAGAEAAWSVWAYRALIFLVISCPCALVISIPLTFFAGIGGASRAGVLIKGANYIETLATARRIAFDKTGTLTQGALELRELHPLNMSPDEMLELAAQAESGSSHPIAQSLLAAYGRRPARPQELQELPGRGLSALVDGQRVQLGHAGYMRELGLHPLPHPGTAIHMAADGVYAGYIVLADKAKAGAAEAICRLRELGLQHVAMLTGDRAAAAAELAEKLGVDEVHSELMPADKVQIVENMLTTGRGKLIFVGDGVNDAPALARADLGIAMGTMCTDAAIEAADVALMRDDPLLIPRAIRIARRCMRIVRQNIALALGVKLLCLLLGALGLANMWLAIFADVGVMLLAIVNAMRALSKN